MGIIQAYKMAIKSILGNKVRAFLTMLGVIIGVCSVIVAVSFALGSTKSITDTISGLGTNLIQISINGGGRNSNRNLKYEDLVSFADKNSGLITAIAPQLSGNVTLKVDNKTHDTSMVGTNDEYETVKNLHVQSGRFLLPFDTDYRQSVVLVGTTIVNDLFPGVDPIGKSIKLNGITFKIVGVLEQKDGGTDQSDDDTVIIPISVAQRMTRSANIRNFSVQAATPESIDATVAKLTDLLTKIYKDPKNFRVFNQAQMLSTLNNITGTMMLVLGGVATISLVVGGIGIMNIMLVSVSERTREIGIRKAIGAKRRNILVQFLIEALMVTGIGGLIGVTGGLCIIHFVIGGFKWVPEVYSLTWILISFLISIVVGVVFGIFPAYKAANLKPIEALRFE